MSCHSESEHASMPSEGGRRVALTDSVVPEARPFGLMILVPYTHFLHTNRMQDRMVDDYCTCVQLQNGRLAGWSKIGCSGWQIPEGGRVLPFELRHSMGTTGRGDVSDSVHYGIGIAVFSSGIGRGACRQMYICNVNRGGIITMKTWIVIAKHLTGRRLMFMI